MIEYPASKERHTNSETQERIQPTLGSFYTVVMNQTLAGFLDLSVRPNDECCTPVEGTGFDHLEQSPPGRRAERHI